MIKEMLEKKDFYKALLAMFLFLIFLIQTILAADVAYVYSKKYKIDNNINNIFSEMNLSVKMIPEKNITKTDFSKYKLIFVGDERFKDSLKIPVNKYPSVLINYYHGPNWGLTDYDGISQLGRSEPQSIRKGNEIIQVYTEAVYDTKRVAIPYYYLANNDKTPEMRKAAGTYSGNGIELGDVISYANAGTHLINGKYAKGNICFFGIVESKYWTPDAKQMFIDCVNFAGTACSKNSDCPSEQTGEKYCKGSDVYQDTKIFKCINPRTVHSECIDELNQNLIETCSFGCLNGTCLAECTKDSDCKLNQKCFNNKCANITCFKDSDCGASGLLNQLSCNNNNKSVLDKYINFTCNNQGQANSFCSNSSEEKKIQECSFACLNGICLNECAANSDCPAGKICINNSCVKINCFKDSECDDSDKYTEDKCLNPRTSNSRCEYNTITCFNNAECGTERYINQLFCKENKVFDKYLKFICNNPGTSYSYCTNFNDEKLVQTCSNGCSDGECSHVYCSKDSECDDNNIYTYDQCNNPGSASSYCSSTLVNCVTDNDCGFTGFFGQEACLVSDVFKNFQSATCVNPKTTSSYCEISTTQKILMDCGEDYCDNYGKNYCKSKSVYQKRTCYNKGCSGKGCFTSLFSDEKLVLQCQSGCLNGECI